MGVYLQEGIDRRFFRLLSALYAPLLSAHHLKDRFQFSIFSSEYPFPLGIISINRGKNCFMQFALIPDCRGRGIAQEALDEIVRNTNTSRVGWGCKRFNYPSLKILHDRKGGIFENSAKNAKGKSYEGFLRVDGEVSAKMRTVLASVLPSSKKEYQKWFMNTYAFRDKELLALRKYLFGYIKSVDSHFHVHPKGLSVPPSDIAARFGKYVSPQKLLKDMDRNAIEKTIIFGVPSKAIDVSLVNRFILDYAAGDSGRFIPFAILDDDTDISEAVNSGFCGFKEHLYGQRLLRDPNGALALASSKRKRLYAQIARAGVPLITHMGPNVIPRVEDILAAVPTLKLVIAHLGASCAGPVSWKEVRDTLHTLSCYPTVTFDISAICDQTVIANAFMHCGTKNILWGSDWPVESQAVSIDRIVSCNSLDMFSMYDIFRGNVERVLQ